MVSGLLGGFMLITVVIKSMASKMIGTYEMKGEGGSIHEGPAYAELPADGRTFFILFQLLRLLKRKSKAANLLQKVKRYQASLQFCRHLSRPTFKDFM